MGLIRSAITLSIALVLVILGATVPLGNRTFFGHIKNIWAADETQDLVEGVKEKSGPVLDEVKEKSGPVFERVKRGVKAGVDEATSDPPAEKSGNDDSAKDEPKKDG